MNKFEKSISKMIWKCGECDQLNESNPLEHHKMDHCKECGITGVDLETYGCRVMGNVKFIEKIKQNFKELRLKPCWGTYGKNGDKDYSKINVSEMSMPHMEAILKNQEPSEYIIWLIKKERKLRKKIYKEYDIGEELKICAHEQDFSNLFDFGNGWRICFDLSVIIKLNKIKEDIYSDFFI